MAGKIKLDGTQFLEKVNNEFKITNSELKLKSTGNTIVDSSGNAVVSESGGTVTLTTDEANVGSNALVVNSSRNVGIGTNSPSTLLEVNSGNDTLPTISSATKAIFATDNTTGYGSGISIIANATGNADLFFGDYANEDQGVIRYDNANDAMVFQSNASEAMRIDSSGNLLFNSGYGSVATAYGCRAWVNFNPQGTIAIRSSGNVSSLADNGTGDYTVNFSTAMPDSNYCAVVFNGITSSLHAIPTRGGSIVAYSNSAIRVSSYYMNSSSIGVAEDGNYSMISIFR